MTYAFDFSKLTIEHAFVFSSNAQNGPHGVSSGILYLILKSGIDLSSIPISEIKNLSKQFWLEFNEFLEADDLSIFFKGADDELGK